MAAEIGRTGGSAPNGSAVAPRAGRPAGRGRPRDAVADVRILEAAFVELARCGITHFSVSAVARRAGVAKNSVYLRWSDRQELMVDASARFISPVVPPRPGPFRDQLRELADDYAVSFGQPHGLEMILRIDADRYRHPELFARMFERIQGAGNRVIEQTVLQAQQRGEIDPAIAPTLVVRMLTGSLFVEALAPPSGEISEEYRDSLVGFIAGRLTS